MTDKKILSDEEEEEEDSEPVVIVTKRKSSIKIVSDTSGGEPPAAPAPVAEPAGGIYQQLTVETPAEELAGAGRTSPKQLSPKPPAALQQPQQSASPTPATPSSSPVRPVSPAPQQQRPAVPVQAPRPVTPQQASPRPAAPQQVSPRPAAPQQVQPARPVPQQQQQPPFVQTAAGGAAPGKTPPWSPQQVSQASPTGFNDQLHPVLRQVPMKPAAPLVYPEKVLIRPLQEQAPQAPPTRVKVQDDFGWRQGPGEAGMSKPERQSSRLGSVWPPPPSDLNKDHGPPVNKIKTQDESSWVQQESVTVVHSAATAPWTRKDAAKHGAQWPPPEAELIKENLPIERTLRPQWPPPSEEVAPSSQVYQKIALQQVHSQVAKQKQYFGSGGQIKPDEGYESETTTQQQQQQQYYQQASPQQRGGGPGARPGVPAKPGVAQKPAAVMQNGPAAGGGRFKR